MDQQPPVVQQPAGGRVNQTFNAEILLIAAIITVFFFLVLLISFHLYVRWWLQRGEASASRSAQVIVVEERHAGLDPVVLSMLPVFVFSASLAAETVEKGRSLLECAVCLSEFEEKDIVRLLPGCGHNFHIECIDMWFQSHSTCPLCRSPAEPAPVAVESAELPCQTEPTPSGSGSGGLCATCRSEECSENAGGIDAGAASSGGRGKAVDVRIDVCPQRRAEIESESTQFSPVGRLLSFKRLLSMGRKSPRPESSGCGAAEVDLEDGLGDSFRVCTPK